MGAADGAGGAATVTATVAPGADADDGGMPVELVTLSVKETYVYAPIPPAHPHHRAELWNVDHWFKVRDAGGAGSVGDRAGGLGPRRRCMRWIGQAQARPVARRLVRSGVVRSSLRRSRSTCARPPSSRGARHAAWPLRLRCTLRSLYLSGP